mgnify:FL=1
MGNLGFAWKFGKSNRQAAEVEQTADDNDNTVAMLQAQVRQLQDENEKLYDKLQKQQEQIEALQQMIEKIVNSNTEKQ